MGVKFALFEFVKDREEIFIKYDILKKSPEFIKNWYIKKFRPYEIEEVGFKLSDGFLIKLPMTIEETEIYPEEAKKLIERVLFDLRRFGVEIILPPKKMLSEFPEIIRFAGSGKMFIFFINQTIKKALKMMKKNIKTAEILIIDGDIDSVFALVDLIYPHVNYLSIMTDDPEKSIYLEKTKEIFADNGLNLIIRNKNKNQLENADIIINTSKKDYRCDFYYKKGATFIELSGNNQNAINLINRRQDMIVSNTLKISLNNKKIFLDLFEAYYYGYSKKYQHFLKRGYRQSDIKEIEKEICRFNLGIPVLTFQNP